MNRRSFMLSVLPAISALSGVACGGARNDVRGLVYTAGTRVSYLSRLLDEISALGPRPIGSPACRDGAAIIFRELSRSCGDVRFDDFTFERWELMGSPEFRVGERELESYPGHGTSGTPPGGVTGILHPCNRPGIPYVLMSGGEPSVYVTTRNEHAVPLPYYSFEQPVKCISHANIGLNDLNVLDEAARVKTPVFVRADVRFKSDCRARNVVGRIGGDSPGELLFIAHHDTVYNTVGANDNTASVIVMILLAHAISLSGFQSPVTFLATTGEEYNKLGAVNYAEKCRNDGTLDNIDYLINFDSLTWGPNMLIQTGDAGLRETISRIDREKELPGDPMLTEGDGFALDGRPFRDDGIRAMYVNSRGYDNLALWHRPGDTPESVPTECADIGFRMFYEYARRCGAGDIPY